MKQMKKVRLSMIKPSKFNIREDMALDEIEISKGIIHRPIAIPSEDGYEVLIGHRRIEKARNEGLNEIEVEIETDLSSKEILIKQGLENLERKSWTPTEEAKHFRNMLNEGISKEEICKTLNLKRRYVEQRLTILHGLKPELVQRTKYSTRNSEQDKYLLTFAKARAISGLPHEDQQILASMIFNQGLTNEQLNKLVRQALHIKHRLEQLEATHPQAAQIIRDFWIPHRFDGSSVYKDMKEEIGIRVGKPIRVRYFLPEEKFDEKQAKEQAKVKMGEYLGTLTRTWHVIFTRPHTIEEIRGKYE